MSIEAELIREELETLTALVKRARKLLPSCEKARRICNAAARSIERCDEALDDIDVFCPEETDDWEDAAPYVDQILSDPPPPPVAIDGPIGGVSPFVPKIVQPAALVSAGHFENGKRTPAKKTRK